MTDRLRDMTDTEHLLQQATYAARIHCLDSLQGDTTCVETTRLLLLILDKLGVERVRPQAVHVRVFNVDAYVAMSQDLPMEQWPDGAHALGTDAPPEVREALPDGWAGHLVIIVRDEKGRRLIDASADQFNRPGLLNVPGPVAMRIEPNWTPLDPQLRPLDDGSTIIEYTPFEQKFAKEYESFSSWNDDPEGFNQAAEDIAQAIRDGWTHTATVAP